MNNALGRVLAAAIPVIAILVAAAFFLPPDFPWFLRQVTLLAIGIGGIALAELALFRTTASHLASRLGFVAPDMRVVLQCLVVSLPMWVFFPVSSFATGTPVSVAPNALELLAGVILVNGLTEEVIHRAFVFGRLRQTRTFLRAASIGAAVFALQHVYLVATIGVAAGVASVVLALLLAYPLCRAFEDSGRSIGAPAILHTSSNASFLIFGDSSNSAMLLLHMAVVLVSIYALFLFPRVTRTGA